MSDQAIDEAALEAARKAVEDVLIDFRDRRISLLNVAHGLVVREPTGERSDMVRLRTVEALRIGIKAYLRAIATSTPQERT